MLNILIVTLIIGIKQLFKIRINLPLFSTVVPENKGKLILTEIFPSVQKHDIFLILINFFKVFSLLSACEILCLKSVISFPQQYFMKSFYVQFVSNTQY